MRVHAIRPIWVVYRSLSFGVPAFSPRSTGMMRVWSSVARWA